MTPEAISNIVLLGGTAAMAAYGGWKGGIRQIGSVAAFLLAFMVARLFGPKAMELLNVPAMAAYALLFAATFVVVMILARILHLTVRLLLLGPVDRLLGAAIGAAKWLLLCSLTLNLLLLCGIDEPWMHTPASTRIANFVSKLFDLNL